MAEKYERIVVEEIIRLMNEQRLTPPQLGRLAFKGERARKVVGQLVEGYQFESARGKKRGLRVSDFFALCMALKESPEGILALASLRLRREGSADDPRQEDCPLKKEAQK